MTLNDQEDPNANRTPADAIKTGAAQPNAVNPLQQQAADSLSPGPVTPGTVTPGTTAPSLEGGVSKIEPATGGDNTGGTGNAQKYASDLMMGQVPSSAATKSAPVDGPSGDVATVPTARQRFSEMMDPRGDHGGETTEEALGKSADTLRPPPQGETKNYAESIVAMENSSRGVATAKTLEGPGGESLIRATIADPNHPDFGGTAYFDKTGKQVDPVSSQGGAEVPGAAVARGQGSDGSTPGQVTDAGPKVKPAGGEHNSENPRPSMESTTGPSGRESANAGSASTGRLTETPGTVSSESKLTQDPSSSKGAGTDRPTETPGSASSESKVTQDPSTSKGAGTEHGTAVPKAEAGPQGHGEPTSVKGEAATVIPKAAAGGEIDSGAPIVKGPQDTATHQALDHQETGSKTGHSDSNVRTSEPIVKESGVPSGKGADSPTARTSEPIIKESPTTPTRGPDASTSQTADHAPPAGHVPEQVSVPPGTLGGHGQEQVSVPPGTPGGGTKETESIGLGGGSRGGDNRLPPTSETGPSGKINEQQAGSPSGGGTKESGGVGLGGGARGGDNRLPQGSEASQPGKMSEQPGPSLPPGKEGGISGQSQGGGDKAPGTVQSADGKVGMQPPKPDANISSTGSGTRGDTVQIGTRPEGGTAPTKGGGDTIPGKTDVPPGKVDAAGGRVDVPGGKGEIPGGKGEATGGRVDVPAGKVDTTGGRVDVPAGKSDALGGRGEPSGGRGDAAGGKADVAGGKGDTSGGRADAPGGTIGAPAGKSDISGGKSDTAGGKTEATGGKSDIPGGKADVPAGKGDASGGTIGATGGKGDAAPVKGDGSGGKVDVTGGKTDVPAGKGDVSGSTIGATGGKTDAPAGKGEVAGGKVEAAGGKGEVAGSKVEAAGGKGEAAGGKGEVAGGKGEVAGGKGEAAGGKGEAAGGKGEAAGGKGEAAGGKAQVAGSKTDAPAGKGGAPGGKVDVSPDKGGALIGKDGKLLAGSEKGGKRAPGSAKDVHAGAAGMEGAGMRPGGMTKSPAAMIATFLRENPDIAARIMAMREGRLLPGQRMSEMLGQVNGHLRPGDQQMVPRDLLSRTMGGERAGNHGLRQGQEATLRAAAERLAPHGQAARGLQGRAGEGGAKSSIGGRMADSVTAGGKLGDFGYTASNIDATGTKGPGARHPGAGHRANQMDEDLQAGKKGKKRKQEEDTQGGTRPMADQYMPDLSASMRQDEEQRIEEEREREEALRREEEDNRKRKEDSRRQKYTVKENDTLESIAARLLSDSKLAALILEINSKIIPSRMLNGKIIVTLRPKMVIWLPSPADIKEYRGRVFAGYSGPFEYAKEFASPEEELKAYFGDREDFSGGTGIGEAGAALAGARPQGRNIDQVLGLSNTKGDAGGRLKYVVRLGDTLKSIAIKHPAMEDVAFWKLLAKINNLSHDTDPKGAPVAVLRRGMQLMIPSAEEISEYREKLKNEGVLLDLASTACSACGRMTVSTALMCPGCGMPFGDHQADFPGLKPRQIDSSDPTVTVDGKAKSGLPSGEEYDLTKALLQAAGYVDGAPKKVKSPEPPAPEGKMDFSPPGAGKKTPRTDIPPTIVESQRLAPQEPEPPAPWEKLAQLPPKAPLPKMQPDMQLVRPPRGEASEEASAEEIAQHLSDDTRLSRSSGGAGAMDAGYKIRLEVKKENFWIPVVAYEVYADVSLRHEFKLDGKRKTIRIDLPPHAVQELAENDLSTNWAKYCKNFRDGKSITDV